MINMAINIYQALSFICPTRGMEKQGSQHDQILDGEVPGLQAPGRAWRSSERNRWAGILALEACCRMQI